MERLKVVMSAEAWDDGDNLHSSMERLKVAAYSYAISHVVGFTFQYGEIKSALCCSTRATPARIYIPVWRD